MKFLANENFPYPSVSLLRQKGIDVLYIFESFPGLEDEKVVTLASSEGRIILTFDKDYGEIIFKYKIDNPPAIVFYRMKGNGPTDAAETLLRILSEEGLSLESQFTIIGASGIRQRKY